MVEYLGSINPDLIFNWDFGGAQILSGSGSGPYRLIFSDVGDFSVSLSVS